MLCVDGGTWVDQRTLVLQKKEQSVSCVAEWTREGMQRLFSKNNYTARTAKGATDNKTMLGEWRRWLAFCYSFLAVSYEQGKCEKKETGLFLIREDLYQLPHTLFPSTRGCILW